MTRVRFPLMARPLLSVVLLGALGEGVSFVYGLGKYYIDLHYAVPIQTWMRGDILNRDAEKAAEEYCGHHPDSKDCKDIREHKERR